MNPDLTLEQSNDVGRLINEMIYKYKDTRIDAEAMEIIQRIMGPDSPLNSIINNYENELKLNNSAN